MVFTQQISRIKGLSDKRRLPRLGKIRLGFKLKKGSMEYPAELPFFLLPSEVAKLYGGKITVDRAKELGVTRANVLDFIRNNIDRLAEEIEIMLPINDIEAVFPNAYKWYGGQAGSKCIGNGEIAMRLKTAMDDTAEPTETGLKNQEAGERYIEIECPCAKLKSETNPKGECTQRGHLLCMLPKVNMGGVYQIDLGSYNSIIDINSGIDYAQSLIGRFALVPLILRRIPTITHHAGQKQTHYTLQLLLNVPIENLEELRKDTSRILAHSQFALPTPEDVNPELDTADVIEVSGNIAGIPEIETIEEKTKNYDFLKVMDEQKKRVGDKEYYEVLANKGFKHANTITDKGQQVKIYKMLKVLPDWADSPVMEQGQPVKLLSQDPEGSIPSQPTEVDTTDIEVAINEARNTLELAGIQDAIYKNEKYAGKPYVKICELIEKRKKELKGEK